jgi:hypothetical protein
MGVSTVALTDEASGIELSRAVGTAGNCWAGALGVATSTLALVQTLEVTLASFPVPGLRPMPTEGCITMMTE